MPNRIIPKKSSVAAKVPLATDLSVGEIAINLVDKKIYTKDSGGIVIELTSSASGAVSSFNTRTGEVTLTSPDVTTALGFTPYNSTNPNGYITSSGSITGSAATLTTGRTIGMTGDVTWTSASFNGSANVTGTATLANSGVTAGTYTKVTVDAKGRVTTGTTISASDIPTLNQNTTGTAGNVTGTVAIANGGTGLTSVGANGTFLKSNGTAASWQSLPSVLSLLNRAGSSVSVSVGNGLLGVLNRGGSTINVAVS